MSQKALYFGILEILEFSNPWSLEQILYKNEFLSKFTTCIYNKLQQRFCSTSCLKISFRCKNPLRRDSLIFSSLFIYLFIYSFICIVFNYSQISNFKLAKMKNNKLNNELVKLINPGQKIVMGITMTDKLGQTKLQIKMKIITWSLRKVYFPLDYYRLTNNVAIYIFLKFVIRIFSLCTLL